MPLAVQVARQWWLKSEKSRPRPCPPNLTLYRVCVRVVFCHYYYRGTLALCTKILRSKYTTVSFRFYRPRNCTYRICTLYTHTQYNILVYIIYLPITPHLCVFSRAYGVIIIICTVQ